MNNIFLSIILLLVLMFVVLTSKEWYVSEFTEIYCIAVLSFAIYLKEKDGFSKLNMIAILLSLNSLINQGSILFILPFLWWVFSDSIKQKNYKVIVTFHPAYLLRKPDQKKFSWEDLKIIRKEIDLQKISI